MIKRILLNRIKQRMFQGRAILLYGPRRTGKTTLVNQLLSEQHCDTIFLNGDEPDVRQILSDATSARLKTIIGKKKIVVIDEAQRIPNIGLTMKLITDNFQDVQLIATGSSALELASRTSEPLTGRKFEFTLYPVSFAELSEHISLIEERRQMEHRLIFGSYPEVVTKPDDAEEILRELAGSYLYKDLLNIDNIARPVLLDKLVRALALQVGNEVSYNELAQLCGSNPKTIEKYVHLLEKAHVVFILPAFTRNARNEIKKGKKIYFIDTGIRNAVIGNWLPSSSRTDIGALWENYLITERRKLHLNSGTYPSCYFWRTASTQAEVDYIETETSLIQAWEFKWGKIKTGIPQSFKTAYPSATASIISPDNFDTFLSPSCSQG